MAPRGSTFRLLARSSEAIGSGLVTRRVAPPFFYLGRSEAVTVFRCVRHPQLCHSRRATTTIPALPFWAPSSFSALCVALLYLAPQYDDDGRGGKLTTTLGR